VASYFNFRFHVAETRWEQRAFARQWWSILQQDKHWVPPYWPDWQGWVGHSPPAHLARLSPIHLVGEAMPQRQSMSGAASTQTSLSLSTAALFEEYVAAGLLLRDPRREDGVAYVAGLQFANDEESLSRFLHKAQDLLAPRGVTQLLLPMGLSPHLHSGLLQNYFHQLPPLHSSYHPPYAPELVSLICRPFGRSLLYRYDLPPSAPSTAPTQEPSTCRLVPLEPGRLAQDLLPLFQAATPSWPGIPPLDPVEAEFLLAVMARWPLEGWLALVEEEPVGFVLAQGDFSPLLRWAQGGRGLLRRLWLTIRLPRARTGDGRLLFGGVLPTHRRRGIGRALWQRLVQHGHGQGWQRIWIGPLPSTAAGIPFLNAQGAVAERTYLLHRYEF
jgi:GNAT superfamily N-acetyltransferase